MPKLEGAKEQCLSKVRPNELEIVRGTDVPELRWKLNCKAIVVVN